MHIRTTRKTDRHIETQADRWIDIQTDRQFKGWRDSQMDNQMYKQVAQMDKRTNGQTDVDINRFINKPIANAQMER
jgi:hypothetical protein